VVVGYEETTTCTNLLVFDPDWVVHQRRVVFNGPGNATRKSGTEQKDPTPDPEPDWPISASNKLDLFRFSASQYREGGGGLMVFFPGGPLLTASERESKKNEVADEIY
jgi:hypothetical protein